MVTTSSRTKSNGPVLRSQSPGGRFCGSYSRAVPSSSSSAFASSTSSSFSSPSSAFFSNHHHHNDKNTNHRSASLTRVNLYTAQPMMSQSFRYSLDSRSISPTNHRSISVSKNQPPKISESRRRCMCSPTTHPGSFRCSLHKNVANPHGQGTASYTTNGLNMRRSAMTNSLVRIGGVEGEWVRRALTTLIRPSSHHLKRRAAYQPRPSRLSSMAKAD
ncbi:PREDICTED: uncharacterized protein LOC104769324 [Camelina sativa]|uniref:Uncharacterized protein LOC104769324 n=1 Tax=Camelina sativa TaxID=90675 RepID=A0ABM0XW07_CAMSA|nr:PREDICTED: uncharacterized protein LOC104769324 [Camelina sativa]